MNDYGKFVSVFAMVAVAACLLMVAPSVEAADAGESVTEEIGGEELLALAQDGVLTLQKDYVVTSALVVGSELIIDLNGHSITNSDANANHTIEVSEEGDLTVNDSADGSSIVNVTDGKSAVYNLGTLAINAGTYAVPEDSDVAVASWGAAGISGGSFSGIVAVYAGAEDALMTIAGGEFDGMIQAWNVVKGYSNQGEPADGKATVTINDGNFLSDSGVRTYIGDPEGYSINTVDRQYAEIVINGGIFDDNVSDYVAEDMFVIVSEGKYNVSESTDGAAAVVEGTYYASLADAVNKTASTTITVLSDLEIDESVEVRKGKNVIDLNGHVVSGSLDSAIITSVQYLTVTDSVGGGAVFNFGEGASVEGQRLTVDAGYYSSDVSGYIPEDKVVYDYQGIAIVSDEVTDPVIVVAEVPFGSIESLVAFIGATGGLVTAEDGNLVLGGDFQVGGVGVGIPIGSEVTIYLNGNDIVFDVVDVEGKLTLTDDSETPGKVTCANFNINGGTLEGDVTITSTSGDALVYVNGSGTVAGLGFDMTDMTGGAVTVNSGATGEVRISDVEILVNSPESIVDRGIYVNQTSEGGSVEIDTIVFDFNGNDACPVNVDIDSSSHVRVSKLIYNDCTRTNKLLVNATSDVILGSGGNIYFAEVSDVVLWDSSKGEENVFTVAGEIVVDGRIAVTGGGRLVIPDDAGMVINDRIEITSDACVTGELTFGSDRTNTIDLADVVAGEGGLTLSLGSVVIAGTVESGTMVLGGNGLIKSDVDLGAAVIEIPNGSELTISKGASVTGTGQMKVAGTVSVFGSLATPVDNKGAVDVYEGGEVSGEVSGNEPVDIGGIAVTITPIRDFEIDLGERVVIAVAVKPGDARLTAAVGDEPLMMHGTIIDWTPEEAGTYTVTVTAEYDGSSDTETFTVTVSEPSDEPETEPFDWRLVAIIIVIVIIIILVVRMLI